VNALTGAARADNSGLTMTATPGAKP